MNYNTEMRSGALRGTAKLGQETNDKWAQFDTLSDRLRGHCKHQTEESMTEYKKHIGQYNDMMIDTPSPEELLAERNSAALGDGVQSFATPRAVIKGAHPEPHGWADVEPIQPAMFEMQEVVDGLPESELQAYKDQMLAEISDREAIVDAINRRLDTVQAKAYTRGVRNAITKQVKIR
jgi:hypothetical protein|nr:MAG TPA: hypothetical protein [Caudoviricetes sp.]